jgi:predicted hydrocarbon binding protein
MEEVIGEMGVSEVLKQIRGKDWQNQPSIPYRVISSIQASLEDLYGVQSGRGVALRSGRAAFRYGLRDFGEQAGMTTPNFRLMPTRTKVLVGANMLARELCQISDQQVHIEEDRVSYRWIVERCPICWGRHADQPVCHSNVGFLQEFLSWAGGGKFYPVSEIECVAKGDPACVFTIAKQALD